MSRFRRWPRKIFHRFSSRFYDLLVWLDNSLRIECVNWEPYREPGVPTIFCCWHGRPDVFLAVLRDRGCYAMIGKNRDGDFQNRLFQHFGYNTIRGSSGQEGIRAAVEAIRVLKKGGEMVMTPDGPRGPDRIAQEGIIKIAQKSGARIVPAGVSVRRRTFLKSWDKRMVPMPYTKGIMVFGEAVLIPEDASAEELEALRQRVERATMAAENEADQLMGHR